MLYLRSLKEFKRQEFKLWGSYFNFNASTTLNTFKLVIRPLLVTKDQSNPNNQHCRKKAFFHCVEYYQGYNDHSYGHILRCIYDGFFPRLFYLFNIEKKTSHYNTLPSKIQRFFVCSFLFGMIELNCAP